MKIMAKVLGIRQISVNPFEKFLQHKQSEQVQILENLYLDIEQDIQESRYIAEQIRHELIKNIPSFIKRLDNIILNPKNFKAFFENKMTYPDESNQTTPLTTKPDYLKGLGGQLAPILVKVVDLDLNQFKQTKSKTKRIFSFYLSIANPNEYVGQMGSTNSAYANSFDKIVVFMFSFSPFAEYKKMNEQEKKKLVEGLMSSYFFIKILTHELRHALDEGIEKNPQLTRAKQRHDIAQAYINAIEDAYPKFLEQDNPISQGLADISSNSAQYVRADIQMLLQTTPELKQTLVEIQQTNPYQSYKDHYPQIYDKYQKIMPKIQTYPTICIDVLEHFARGTEDLIPEKYKIDLNHPNNILPNLCALHLFLLLKTLGQNLMYFVQGTNGMIESFELQDGKEIKVFNELTSRFLPKLASMINEQEIYTYRVDSISEIMIASCLGLNFDDIPYLLKSQQSFNALLFSKFEIFESPADTIDISVSDNGEISKRLMNAYDNFKEQIDTSILEMLDKSKIDWLIPDYRDESLTQLNIFLKTHTENEADIPNEEIIEFVQFLESNRKENGLYQERSIGSIVKNIIQLIVIKGVYISSTSKACRNFSNSILYDSLMERPKMDANIKFFQQFIKNVQRLKSKILKDLSFAKHNIVLLRPFIGIRSDEERVLLPLLINKSKLENIYERIQIPKTNPNGNAFAHEMISYFKQYTEKLADCNQKFLDVMDQIIMLTRQECLEICTHKVKTQAKIDKIIHFFNTVIEEQAKIFHKFSRQMKQASFESYATSHEFFLEISTTLYHMLTANIFNQGKQSPFSDYLHKKYSKDKINKPINAENFISLKDFTHFLASHFCIMLSYRLTYEKAALKSSALFGILDDDQPFPYSLSNEYTYRDFDASAKSLEHTIEAMVSVIEMSTDVAMEDRMLQIIVIAGFLKLLRSFE